MFTLLKQQSVEFSQGCARRCRDICKSSQKEDDVSRSWWNSRWKRVNVKWRYYRPLFSPMNDTFWMDTHTHKKKKLGRQRRMVSAMQWFRREHTFFFSTLFLKPQKTRCFIEPAGQLAGLSLVPRLSLPLRRRSNLRDEPASRASSVVQPTHTTDTHTALLWPILAFSSEGSKKMMGQR